MANSFPCKHERDETGNPSQRDYWVTDGDFEVICSRCYGHFSSWAGVAYFAFVAMFTVAYFWHPLGLNTTLYAAFCTFVFSYLSAVLRRRPVRLLLTICVLLSVAWLVAAGPDIGHEKTLASAWSAVAAASVLGLCIAGGLLSGVLKVARSEHGDMSPILALLLVASFGVTLIDIVLSVGLTAVPVLATWGVLLTIADAVRILQRYRFAAILVCFGIAAVWAGGRAVAATAKERREGMGERADSGGHFVRLMLFFRAVLAQFVLEMWRLIANTARHLWSVAAGSARVVLLIVSAWWLAGAVQRIGSLTAGVWGSDEFWTGKPAAKSLIVLVLTIWLSSWSVIVVAIVGDRRNRTKNWNSAIRHAYSVVRFNLLHSTPVYWFYLSLVLFVSWTVIAAVTFARNPEGDLRVGTLSMGYLCLVLVVGGGTLLVGAMRKAV